MKKLIKNQINSSNIIYNLNSLSRKIVILRYHSIKDNPADHDPLLSEGIIHSTKTFKRQMVLLSKKYHPISMDDLLEILAGKKSAPKRSVLVTFDDGYADNAEIAAPILNQYGIPGAFYLTVGSIGSDLPPWYIRLRYLFWATLKKQWVSPVNTTLYSFENRESRMAAFIDHCRIFARMNSSSMTELMDLLLPSLEVEEGDAYSGLMMTWKQARNLANDGHVVGSHTMTHPNLTYINAEEAQKEIVESKSIIESHLGFRVKHFCYPNPALNPNFNADTVGLVEDAGYLTAVTSESGCVDNNSSPYVLPRLAVPSCEIDFRWYLDSTFLGRKM